MHNGIGAFEVNAAAALVALLAAVVRLASWRKTGHGYMLCLCAGWLGLCVYFSLLAISAGYSPVWNRDELAPTIRLTLAVAVTLIAGGKLLMLRVVWKYAPPHSGRRRDST